MNKTLLASAAAAMVLMFASSGSEAGVACTAANAAKCCVYFRTHKALLVPGVCLHADHRKKSATAARTKTPVTNTPPPTHNPPDHNPPPVKEPKVKNNHGHGNGNEKDCSGSGCHDPDNPGHGPKNI